MDYHTHIAPIFSTFKSLDFGRSKIFSGTAEVPLTGHRLGNVMLTITDPVISKEIHPYEVGYPPKVVLNIRVNIKH
jgi:hypothetical protein